MALSGHNSNNYLKLLDQKKKLFEQADIGESPQETGNNPHRINEYGEKEILQYREKQKWLTPSEIQEIAGKYNNGSTTYELAEEYGCHRSSISHALKSVGITPRTGRKRNILDESQVIKRV